MLIMCKIHAQFIRKLSFKVTFREVVYNKAYHFSKLYALSGTLVLRLHRHTLKICSNDCVSSSRSATELCPPHSLFVRE